MGEFEALGSRLKSLRSQLNMNQTEFAEFIGISTSTLSAYEIGAKNPSIGIFKSIAEKCHVSIDWLCGLTDNQNYDKKIETYNDLFRMLFEIEDSCEGTIYLSYDIDCTPFDSSTRYELNSISFLEDTAQKFITEWGKMKKLYTDNIIDDEVYNLWKEKILKKNYISTPNGGFSNQIIIPEPSND